MMPLENTLPAQFSRIKIRFIVLLLIANCSLFINYAQQPTQEWVNRFSDTANTSWGAYSIKRDSLGFIYVLGETSNDFGFLKYSSNGNLLFVASYWPGGFDAGGGSHFDVTPGGDVYITGSVSLSFNQWIYTVKYNSNGVLQWGKLYNTDNNDESSDIKVDKNGNIIIVGGSLMGSMGYALTIKYNNGGDTLWTRKFRQPTQDAGNAKLALDNSNNIYIVGTIGLPGLCLILKYSSTGNLDWFTTFTSHTGRPNLGDGIVLDTTGNIYIIGRSSEPASAYNNFLLKFSNAGSLNWSRIFTGIFNGQPGLNDGLPLGPVVSLDGNSIYYLTRTENGTGGGGYGMATLKYNSAGDSQWVKIYNGGGVPGNANIAGNINLDKNGNIYICGSGYFQNTGSDFVTIKYTPSGIQQWVATYSGLVTNGADYAKDLLIDTNLNVYVTGASKKNNNNGYVAVTIKYNQPVGIITENGQLPENYLLSQNYPNPFNPITTISYQLPKISEVNLSVYDILGAEVKTLVSSKQEAGTYSIMLNMENYASGIYFYCLKAGNNFIETKKMVYIE